MEANVPPAALEAIVQRTGRPPLLIRNDEVQLEELVDFPPDTDRLVSNLNKKIPSVGRVEFLNFRMSWGGTGWVIARKGSACTVVTNRHVAKLVATRAANGHGLFMRSPTSGARYGAQIDFHEEAGSPANDSSRTVQVTDIAYIADDLEADIALLTLSASTLEISPLDLADKEIEKGALVALIGYPAFDSRNDANDQARYFRDLYEVKRLAPGKVLQALSGSTTLTHDCTSLGGNSGSPLFNLADGKVVGLHFSGVYGVENTAVGVETLKRVLAGGQTIVAVAAQVESASDGHHDASTFGGRDGFIEEFLERPENKGKLATPWPRLSAAVETGLAQPSDSPPEPGELRYTHFGVKYSREFKLPAMTGVNIDGARSVRIKRSNDKWFTDGRIPEDEQLGAKNYGLDIDRGHMVRREDPNWGDSSTAVQANDDTFHYVNAAPQHSLLNQGKSLWQGLENYILDNSRTSGFQACVFTGPVLAPDLEELDGANIPLEFWKMVATLDEKGEKLRATAYLLSQGQLIRDLLEKRSRTEANEGVVLGEYRTFQIAVSDLAQATGYDFSQYVQYDPLAHAPGQEAVAPPRFIPLDSPTQIVL